MKIAYNIKTFAIASMLGLSLTSCSDWLKVDMNDQVLENSLFSNYNGFRAALNGIYLSMNDLYTSYLGAGGIDVMAQYYYVTENDNHTMRMYSGYKYTDSAFETVNSYIWSSLYTLLANTNVLIEHTDDNADVLTAEQRALMRGEALALRAFFHFDLLRLYGPIYSLNPNEVCIPYQGSSHREIQPLLPADEVLGYIIRDLKDAEALLSEYDPVITSGVGDIVLVDDGTSAYDSYYRQIRLNYYAVEAMLARAYLWKGDKAEAYKYAKTNVIDKITTDKLTVFPWTKREDVLSESAPDNIFSSEVMFALYNSKRLNNLNNALFASSLARSSRLAFVGSSLGADSKVGSFYDDPNDLRRKMWSIVEPTEAEIQDAINNNLPVTNSLAFNKYINPSGDTQSTTKPTTFRYMIPLIRLSEMYFIAAETTADSDEAFSLINTVRNHRECANVSKDTSFDNALTYEMAREVIGEGQLFYFYKRRAVENMISGTSPDGTYPMLLNNYVMPLPQSELDQRVIVGSN